MKRAHGQPDLFATPAQPRHRGREDPGFYFAVRLLRKLGNRVYRAGRDHHLFNGRRIDTQELIERAGG